MSTITQLPIHSLLVLVGDWVIDSVHVDTQLLERLRLFRNTDRRARQKLLVGTLPTTPFNMSRYSTIFFYHTRKAGGTTMRRWLEKVAKKHNLTFVAKEGDILRDADFHNDTLAIAILRNPIDRAISSYWFEGRWPQKERNRSDENSPLGLFNWTSQVNRQTRGKRLWYCASDCYCKWFGSSIGGNYNHNVTNALARLKQFDVVAQIERLGRDDNYTRALQMAVNATKIPIRLQNSGVSSHGNSNFTITQAHRDHLAEMNQNGVALYAAIFGARHGTPVSWNQSKADTDATTRI